MAKQTNSGSYLLPICDFSRGSLNVRLQTTPAKSAPKEGIEPIFVTSELRGHKYRFYSLFRSVSFDVCFFYSEAVVLSAAESVEAAGAVSVPACVVGSVR